MTVTRKIRKATPRRAGPEYVLDEVVVPRPVPARVQPIYFPFSEMEIGRSFTTKRTPTTLISSIRRYRAKGNEAMEFRVRPLPEGGCRVWRIK